MKQRLIIDMDGVIVDCVTTICDIYNRFHKEPKASAKKAWKWNLSDQCPNFDEEDIKNIFESNALFTNMRLFRGCKEVLERLSKAYDLELLTIGSLDNIKLKCDYLRHKEINQYFSKITMVDNISHNPDKSFYNMENCIFIDDNAGNLESVKHYKGCRPICFGKAYEYNEKWKGERVKDWFELEELLKESE